MIEKAFQFNIYLIRNFNVAMALLDIHTEVCYISPPNQSNSVLEILKDVRGVGSSKFIGGWKGVLRLAAPAVARGRVPLQYQKIPPRMKVSLVYTSSQHFTHSSPFLLIA